MTQTSNFNPYPGLRPFKPGEDYLFFSRKADISATLSILSKQRFVAITGNIGVGKSSLVNCGLTSALYKGELANVGSDWKIMRFLPSSLPLQNLARVLAQVAKSHQSEHELNDFASTVETALRKDSRGVIDFLTENKANLPKNILFVIDDFHKIFQYINTSEENNKEYHQFFALIAEAVKGQELNLYTAITIITEEFDATASISELASLINNGKYILPDLSRDEIKKAIEGPLVRTGEAKITANLLNRLINDINRADIPLCRVQYSLNKTFELWDKHHKPTQEIEIKHYELAGNTLNAIQNNAEAVFIKLSEHIDARMLSVFLTEISGKSPKGYFYTQRKSFTSLQNTLGCTDEELKSIINAYKQIGLVHVEIGARKKFIELSHGSVCMLWERLKLLLEEKLKKAGIQEMLLAKLDEPNEKSRILEGDELDSALIWFKEQYSDFRKINTEKAEAIVGMIQTSRQQALDSQSKKGVRASWRVIALIFIFLSVGSLSFAGLMAIRLYFVEKQNQRLEIRFNAARADNLVYRAEEIKDKDATAAFLLTQQAMQYKTSKRTGSLLSSIYAQGVFYRIVSKQQSEIKSVAYAPDGETFVLGTHHHKIMLHNAVGAHLKTIDAHSRAVTSLAFAPNSKFFVSGSADNTAIIWHKNGEPSVKLVGHSNGITATCFSPNNLFVATGSLDNTVKIWNMEGKLIRTLLEQRNKITAIKFSPDGKTIASSSLDGSIIGYDLSGNVVFTLEYPTRISDFEFHPSGTMLLVASYDNTVHLRGLDGAFIFKVKSHTDYVRTIRYIGNGEYFASASDDKTIAIYNSEGKITQRLVGHSNSIYDIDVSPNTEQLVSVSSDNTARIWDISCSLPKIIKGHKSTVTAVGYAPNNEYIVSTSANKNIRIFSTDLKLLKSMSGHSQRINTMAISSDSKYILTCSNDKTVLLWDVETGNSTRFEEHTAPVYTCAFTPDNKSIVSAGADNSVIVRGINGDKVKTINLHTNAIWSVAISPNGKHILTGSDDNKALLFDFDGTLQLEVNSDNMPITAVAFSNDGNCFATASLTSNVTIWGIDGNEKQTLIGHERPINSIQFSKDDLFILTSSEDRTAILWSIEGEIVQVFNNHRGIVWQAAFSPSGNKIITGANDKLVAIQRIKPSLKGFTEKMQKQALTIEQKLQFGITDFEECFATTDTVSLYFAAGHYFQTAKNEKSITVKSIYLNNSLKLYQKLIGISKTVNYLSGMKETLVALKKFTDTDKYDSRIQRITEDIFDLKPDDQIITEMVWTQILNRDYPDAIKNLRTIISKDSANKEAYRNLAIALLLNNDFGKAEQIYRTYKDTAYNYDYSMRTMFLGDLRSLEYEGIMHPDIDKAFKILQD